MDNFLVNSGRKEMEKSIHYNWKNKKEKKSAKYLEKHKAISETSFA